MGGGTTITSTIRCRPTKPRKTTTSTIRCLPTNPPSVIRPSIVTTTIAATRNKTVTKSVNGSAVVSAARAAKEAKEARVATMVAASEVTTVVMIFFTLTMTIAVIYKHSVVREVTVAKVERVDTTAGVDTKSVTPMPYYR